MKYLILLMILMGCGGGITQEDDSTTLEAIVEDEEGAEVATMPAKLLAALPENCTAEEEGNLIYVPDLGFHYCEQEAWHSIDLKGKDGADGKDGLDGTNGAPGKDGLDGSDGMTFKQGWDCETSTDILNLELDITVKAFVFEFTDGSFFIHCSTLIFEALTQLEESRALFYPPGKESLTCTALNTHTIWTPLTPNTIAYWGKDLIFNSNQVCHEFGE